MESITLSHREGTTEIRCGEPFAALLARIDRRRTVIVTDPTVKRLHGAQFGDLPVVTTGEGESNKTLASVAALYDAFHDLSVDRSWRVLAVGGGIVCDIAAFAAATWMRGVGCTLVPTTLLAMVDAAIGGKNGVNFHGYKNLVGTIRQPGEVVVDPAFLATLPPREIACGRAEMLKHGLIADADYLAELEKRASEPIPAAALIARSIAIKVAVVADDETERDRRRILNFGHTVGHALEKLDPGIAHGEAVAVGMTLAAGLSARRGLIDEVALDRVRDLIATAGLPTDTARRADEMAAAVRSDKKRQGDTLAVVLLKKIGEAIVVEIPFSEMEAALGTVCQHR